MKSRFVAGIVFFLIGWGSAFAAEFEPYLPQVPTPERVFWVAVDGNDANTGTQSEPFATFARAIAAVKAFRANGGTESVGVYFAPGRYVMTEPIVIESLQGTPKQPILLRRAPGAESNPVFTGGKQVTGWEKLADSEFWRTADEHFKQRIRPGAVEKIQVAPYDDFETALYDPGVYAARQELFAANRPQTLARWPNDDFALAGKALGKTPITSWASRGTKEGIFEAAEDQPLGWNNEPGALLFGYWFWDWSESFERLERVDEQAGTIQTKEPYHGYGFKDNLRYYGFNLLCELDSAGEYYIDRELKKIFWIPTEGVDPATVETVLTTFEKPWMVNVTNCENLIFAGLTFSEGFGGGIKIENSRRVLLADSVFARFGRDALEIKGGSECGVYHCLLETLGCGGINISGGNRKTLTDAKHFVSETTVREFSRIKRTYAPAVHADGCGMKFDHCDFSGSSSSAMRLEGNEFLVEYSRFTDLVDESDDQGGIDVYYNPTYRGNVIRYNRWENIVGGTHCGAAAIRLDDMISGYTIFGNIFVHCGSALFGAVQIHGGKDNLVQNNVLIDCAAIVSFSSWGNRYTDAFTNPESPDYGAMQKKCYEQVDIRSELWRQRYPEIEKIAENADANRVCDNLAVNCQNLFLRPGDSLSQENNVAEQADTVSFERVLSSENLEKHGLKPIPADQMGPTGAGWLAD